MLLIIVTLATVAATCLMWWLTPRHRHLWTVFVAYTALLPWFGVIYRELYLRDHRNFSFASAVAEARIAELNAPVYRKLESIARRESVLKQLVGVLATTPRLSLDGNRHEPIVKAPSGDILLRVVHFSLVPLEGKQMPLLTMYEGPTFGAQTLSSDYDTTIGIDARTRGLLHFNIIMAEDQGSFVPTVFVIDSILSQGNRLTSRGAKFDLLDSSLYREWATACLNDAFAHRKWLTKRLVRASDTQLNQWGTLDFVYFSVITQATIGYGDIIPNSHVTRMVVMAQVLVSVALLTVVLTYAAAFIQRRTPTS
jgi:hypothetical protein